MLSKIAFGKDPLDRALVGDLDSRSWDEPEAALPVISRSSSGRFRGFFAALRATCDGVITGVLRRGNSSPGGKFCEEGNLLDLDLLDAQYYNCRHGQRAHVDQNPA